METVWRQEQEHGNQIAVAVIDFGFCLFDLIL